MSTLPDFPAMQTPRVGVASGAADTRTSFFVGSMNRQGPYLHATGEGVTHCLLDETTGEISRVAVCHEAENAIWLAWAGPVLLVASERYFEDGEISAFAVQADGVLQRIGQGRHSHGGAICHIAVTPDARTAIVTSYLGGVSVHALAPDGAVAPAHQTIQYAGGGPILQRQDGPHPHQATPTPDGGYLLVCDLGCDRIWIHAAADNLLDPPHGLEVEPGSGPRHLVFHPRLPRFYLLGELDAKLRVYEGGGEDWRLLTTHDTLPADFTGEAAGAAIRMHPSGRSLVVSNRNSDSLTVFALGPLGDIVRAACFACGGRTPRDCAFSPTGHWLVCANQDSGELRAFGFDPHSGLPDGRVGPPWVCGSPVAVLF